MESVVSNMKQHGHSDLVGNEVMAQFYFNIADVYDRVKTCKNNMPEISKIAQLSMSYREKALETTNDIELVENIKNSLIEFQDRKFLDKITNACERVINANPSNENALYRANMLYADSLANAKKIDVFNGRQERYTDAISHYKDAIKYTSDDNKKMSILKNISKMQKTFSDSTDYIKTRLEISTLMHGRERINERLTVVDEIKDIDLKTAVLKSCVNEFAEIKTESINSKDRKMYDIIDAKLREVVPTEDIKTINKLDELKKTYGTQKKSEVISMLSSGGKHFEF